jgi:Tol biopolymer transport system component
MKRSAIAVLLLALLALAAVLLGGGLTGASTGATERVSVDSAGNQTNDGSSAPAVSADGRYVAFRSYADNLVPGDTNNSVDVFVHDRLTSTTQRVSVDSAGNQGNDDSYAPAISDDGRYVAFSSYASNLVEGDSNNCEDVFVHDRQTGATERVSVDSAGKQGDDDSGTGGSSSGFAGRVDISADGRYVAFGSWASNLVQGDTNGWIDVFVHDRQARVTERVSVDSAGEEKHYGGDNPAISGDGRYVAFQRWEPHEGGPTSRDDIFVHDRQTGATELVSVDSAGSEGDTSSTDPAISADGRYVAFYSYARNLVPGDTNGRADVFVHDRQTGATTRVSVDSAGNEGNDGSGTAGVDISADGRYVAFQSRASNLVSGDTNTCLQYTVPGACSDIFVHDRDTDADGIFDEPDAIATERVSVDSAGNQGNGDSYTLAMSADARYVAFYSYADNLVPGDTNAFADVFAHDRGTTAPPPPTPTPPAGPYRTFAWGPGWHNGAWSGPDGTPPRDAFACAAGSYAAAYRYVDGGLERFFPDRPDISDMGPLNSHDAFLILITQPVTCLMPVGPIPGASRTLQWGPGWHNAGWSGADGTPPQDAFACAAGGYAAAYRYVDGGLERFFPDRPDISDMRPLNKYDAFIILVTAPVSCTMPIVPYAVS